MVLVVGWMTGHVQYGGNGLYEEHGDLPDEESHES